MACGGERGHGGRAALGGIARIRGLPAIRRSLHALAVMAAVGGVAVTAARATDDSTTGWKKGTRVSREPSREAWTGAEAFGRVYALYTGTTWSPFGNLRQDGLRVRAVTAQSHYAYSGRRFVPAVGDAMVMPFIGQARIADLLAGYQVRRGDWTVKVFAGLRTALHVIAPYDEETRVQGSGSGASLALEVWGNLTPERWLALDLGYATPFDSYSARLRLGQRFAAAWSAGGEASAVGNIEGRTLRFGAFVRFDDGVNEIGVAGGLSLSGGQNDGYASAQWLRRF